MSGNIVFLAIKNTMFKLMDKKIFPKFSLISTCVLQRFFYITDVFISGGTSSYQQLSYHHPRYQKEHSKVTKGFLVRVHHRTLYQTKRKGIVMRYSKRFNPSPTTKHCMTPEIVRLSGDPPPKKKTYMYMYI